MLVEEIKWRLIQALKLQPCWPAYACFPVPNSLNCEYRGIFVSAWWVSQCSYVLSPHAVLLLLSFHRVDPHSDTWSNNQPIIVYTTTFWPADHISGLWLYSFNSASFWQQAWELVKFPVFRGSATGHQLLFFRGSKIQKQNQQKSKLILLAMFSGMADLGLKSCK